MRRGCGCGRSGVWMSEEDSGRESLVEQFGVARYEADRAHELALDVASAGFEVAFFQNAFLLNGGSATAFLAFVSPTLGTIPRSVALLEGFAMGAWILGVVLAAAAGILAYKAQRAFLRAARAKRHGRMVKDFPATRHLWKLADNEDAASLAEAGGQAESSAEVFWRLSIAAMVLTVGAFVVGIGLAGAALIWWRSAQ